MPGLETTVIFQDNVRTNQLIISDNITLYTDSSLFLIYAQYSVIYMLDAVVVSVQSCVVLVKVRTL